jgi:hypothetical protein
MKWVTRSRPKTDRIACPWLIRRFIDPDAQILFVPADQVLDTADREGGYSFDTKDATYGQLHTDPLGAGLLAIGQGGLHVEDDDHRLLERGMFVYDALYAWCQHHAEAAG